MRNENIDHPQFLRTKHFSKTAKFLGIPDQVFLTAIDELQCNDHHVEIGHGVYQKTINNGSHVAILLHNSGEYWIFSYLFSTAERSTLTTNELNAFVELAKAYRLMTEDQFLSLLDRKTADLMLIGGRFKRGAFEAIHAAATALHNDFLITNKTMQQFNAVCIGKSKTLKPQDIKKIRKGMNVSRTLFSECLNVSRATVAQWERGEKYPTGAALRLLFVVEKHGIQVLS